MQKKIIRARDVMREQHLEMDGTATVKEALNAMKEANANVVIVKKRHDNDAFGIVLLSDIAKKVLAKDRAPTRVNIYEIMTKPVISVRPDMDIRYCARLFDRLGLSRAPVLRHGKVVGIVSFTDMILRGFFHISNNK